MEPQSARAVPPPIPPPIPPPRQVRLLVVLLAVTAVVTVVVELLNWWIADDGGYPLFVRTAWALLRAIGFLVLIWQVNRGRAGAAPFALILSVTTLFALARLVLPRQGAPHALGVAGFALVAALCAGVLLLLYRSAAVREHLTRHRNRIVLTRRGLDWRPAPPRHPPANGWLLTARIAALTYSPLMLVSAFVAVGQLFTGRLGALPLVVAWLIIGFAVSYASLPIALFLVRGKRWPRTALLILSLAVLAIDLPLCWILLGADGLIRDGAPLAITAGLALLALWRTRLTHQKAAM